MHTIGCHHRASLYEIHTFVFSRTLSEARHTRGATLSLIACGRQISLRSLQPSTLHGSTRRYLPAFRWIHPRPMMHYTCSRSFCCKCRRHPRGSHPRLMQRIRCSNHIAGRNLCRFESLLLESGLAGLILGLSKTNPST